MILRKLVSSVASRLHPQLCGIERFVGGLKSADAGSFAGETDDGGALALRLPVHPQAGEVIGSAARFP